MVAFSLEPSSNFVEQFHDFEVVTHLLIKVILIILCKLFAADDLSSLISILLVLLLLLQVLIVSANCRIVILLMQVCQTVLGRLNVIVTVT